MSKYNSAMDGCAVLMTKEVRLSGLSRKGVSCFFSLVGGLHGRKSPALFTCAIIPSNLLIMEKNTLVDRLAKNQPRIITENSNYAAVSIVLLIKEDDHELFLIKRTTHPNDPWSGQIGLPGGRHEDEDENLIETAIRETFEETNIILTNTHLVTQIDDQQGYATGGKINLTVRPYVFFVDTKPAITINYELDHYYWLPVSHFTNNQNHLYFNPIPNFSDRPGVQIDNENVLWGMTYRIMTDFFKAIEIETPFVGDYDRSR